MYFPYISLSFHVRLPVNGTSVITMGNDNVTTTFTALVLLLRRSIVDVGTMAGNRNVFLRGVLTGLSVSLSWVDSNFYGTGNRARFACNTVPGQVC